MNNLHIRKQFQQIGLKENVLTYLEIKRVNYTASLVPANWLSVVDVGCGDGRVGNLLISKGVNVLGLDFADTRLDYFQSDKIAADIKEEWPFTRKYDGAVCAEVLEHLSKSDGKRVIQNISTHIRLGFVISVPAREVLEANFIKCSECHEFFHLYGHRHIFQDFNDVDNLVGKKSSERIFVPGNRRNLLLISKARLKFGLYNSSKDTICLHCGKTQNHGERNWWQKIISKWLSFMEILFSILVPKSGWFVCRYEENIND